MPPQQQPNPVQTIEITNFGGRLTRLLNGDLNSGMAKFVTSFGYDPFSKPGNLTWFEQPTSILSSATNMVTASKSRSQGATGYPTVYAVAQGMGTAGASLLGITPNSISNPNLDTVSMLGAIVANAPGFNNGASMDFFGVSEKIYVSGNTQINSIGFDGSGDAKVGTTGYLPTNDQYRPLKQIPGKLIFGNGNTIGAIDGTGTVISSIIGTGRGNIYSELNPALPVENNVHDLDLSPDGNYLLVTAGDQFTENISTTLQDGGNSAATTGALYSWNFSDPGYTGQQSIPFFAPTALQTHLSKNYFFSNDAFGASLNDGEQKLLTLPKNKSPLPNATLINGNFISWANPEVSPSGTGLNASMYYFGSLDQENPPGLYRPLRYTPSIAGNFVNQVPLNTIVSSNYATVNNNISSVLTTGYGKHYIALSEVGQNTVYKLFRFLVTSTGTGTPQLGVYETQTQLFGNRMAVKQIRVYTEPTATGNGFQVDMIGSDGTVMTNGTYNYTFAAGTDITKLQGALERIDFNPTANASFSLGLRVTNTGTVNMTIKKIEIDWIFAGK